MKNNNTLRRVAFSTLGCKVNQYETQAMKRLFIANGDAIVDDNDIADIYIINTCTVTKTSDKKSRQLIRRARRQNPDAIVAVVGCYSEISPEEIDAIEGVNLVLGTDERAHIVKHVEAISADERMNLVDHNRQKNIFEPLKIKDIEDKTRAFIKIQDGCNQFCSFCIIPYARGRIRSRALDEIVSEISTLALSGFKEFVLTGIHLASYGMAKDDAPQKLIDVIEAVSDIIGVERIRLGSLEPRVITEDFIARLVRIPQFCPQFHLSLQSGCNATLKRMNRKYTAEEYMAAVHQIRSKFEKAAITTDVIVGFAGETEAEFNETFNFIKRLKFAQIHIFPYSRREGTKGYHMPNQVPEQIKKERSSQLIQMGKQMEYAYLKCHVGDTLSVLIEHVVNGVASGVTIYHSKVEIADNHLKEGEIIKCYMQNVVEDKLIGSIVTKE